MVSLTEIASYVSILILEVVLVDLSLCLPQLSLQQLRFVETQKTLSWWAFFQFASAPTT